MSWLGTGSNAKDVGSSISYVYNTVDENDELIDLTLSLQPDAAVQFWLDQKQSKQGERTHFDRLPRVEREPEGLEGTPHRDMILLVRNGGVQ